MSYSLVEKSIGCRFRQKKWIQRALTHPSYRHEHSLEEHDNQRLEYVGDAVLGLMAAHALYHQYPDADEGQLSTLRSWLTKDDTLAQIGQKINLGHHLRLGKGELQNGGADRKSNLADAIEAILGAACKTVVEEVLKRFLKPYLCPYLNKLTNLISILIQKGNSKSIYNKKIKKHQTISLNQWKDPITTHNIQLPL